MRPHSSSGPTSPSLRRARPFLADGTFTILRRLKNRENILKAHRSHLYQRLVIAGRSHLQVTLLYGALAVVGAGLAWRVVAGVAYAFPLAVGIVAVLFVGLWGWTVMTEGMGKRSTLNA